MNNTRMQTPNNRCNRPLHSDCNEMNKNGRMPMGCPYPKIETAKDMVVAMAYVPWQYFGNVYEPDKALQMGTIFPELNKPYEGCRGGRC